MSSADRREVAADNRISAGTWFASAFLGAVAAACILAFVPSPFDLTPELAMVDQYSPKELQVEAAAQTELVIWQNAISMPALAGLTWGIVQSLFLMLAGRIAGAKLILVGLVVGTVIGAGVGQLGLTLRGVLNSESAVASIQDPLYRDALFYLVLSFAFAVIPATIYRVCKSGPGTQQMIAILLAAGLGGAIVPMVASLFPSVATNVFPPRGLGIAASWFGVLGIVTGAIPGFVGSKTNSGNSGDKRAQSDAESTPGNAG